LKLQMRHAGVFFTLAAQLVKPTPRPPHLMGVHILKFAGEPALSLKASKQRVQSAAQDREAVGNVEPVQWGAEVRKEYVKHFKRSRARSSCHSKSLHRVRLGVKHRRRRADGTTLLTNDAERHAVAKIDTLLHLRRREPGSSARRARTSL
jgi:hypothetical protein